MANQGQGPGTWAPLHYARELQKRESLATSLSKGAVTLWTLDVIHAANHALDSILLNGCRRGMR